MPRLFFGNAITSRIDCSPQINMTKRSSPSAMPPCGGAPSRKARSKWPNSNCRSSGADPEHFEHFFLQLRLVNSHAAAADLDAVENDVVGFRPNLGKFASLTSKRHVLGFRSRERMMHRVPFVFLRAPLQQRKIVTQRKSKSEPDWPLPECNSNSESLRFAAGSARALRKRSPICRRAKKIRSPSSIFNFDCNASFSASLKNFTIGDFHSPPSTLIKASPLAPNVFAISVSSSA